MDELTIARRVRAFLDELLRTPYVKRLEEDVQEQRDLRREEYQSREVRLMEVRADLTERLRDKEGIIQDLRLRLAVAEADLLRDRAPKIPPPARVVPEFGGPLPFQDELYRMAAVDEKSLATEKESDLDKNKGED